MKNKQRGALIHQHMERVSGRLLAEYPEVVRNFIGKNFGIYALYRRNKLYYVGLATGLSSRLKAHLRDKHKQKWDQFSIYLTIRDQHIKELEALLLQIVKPPGNSVGGRPKGSINILPLVMRAIRQRQNSELSSLFSTWKRGTQLAHPKEKSRPEQEILKRLFPRGIELRAVHKGTRLSARVRADGTVRFNRSSFSSLSAAAS